MDEQHSNASPRRRSGAERASHQAPRATARTPHLGQLPDVAASDDIAALAGAPTNATDTSGAPQPPDPRDPRTMERLRKRTPSGGYEVSDIELVRAIRVWNASGVHDVVNTLCELLVDRCMPEFRRRAMGLRQRPDLMEDAIADMIEQLLREALDPTEIFMTQNFIHYIKCVGIDNFKRKLRNEGLSYNRDEQGRPVGRPQHIPRALIDQISLPTDDHDEPSGAGDAVADPRDSLSERMAAIEAQRILDYLPDPLDQRIMVLRVLESRQWEEIAKICGKTERTMRLRYEKARILLQERLAAEKADADSAGGERNI